MRLIGPELLKLFTSRTAPSDKLSIQLVNQKGGADGAWPAAALGAFNLTV